MCVSSDLWMKESVWDISWVLLELNLFIKHVWQIALPFTRMWSNHPPRHTHIKKTTQVCVCMCTCVCVWVPQEQYISFMKPRIHVSRCSVAHCVALRPGDPQESVVYSYRSVGPTLSLFAPTTLHYLHGNLMSPFGRQAELQISRCYFWLLKSVTSSSRQHGSVASCLILYSRGP